MKKSAITLLLLTAACTPKIDNYCDRYGVGAPSNTEYAACQAYYTKMDNWFKGDRNVCRTKANLSVPESMDDRPHYEDTEFVDRFGRTRTGTELVEPNFGYTQSIEQARRSIIVPCMREHGWKNPDNWQAGRTDSATPPPPL